MFSGQSVLLFCRIWLFCAAPAAVSGLNIRFYDGPNKSGYYHEVTSFKGDCAQVDNRVYPVKGSIQTDTCLMVYMGEHCEDFSAKILPGTQDINLQLIRFPYTTSNYYVLMFGIRSYSLCTENVGGAELIVDVYYNQEPKHEFKNVCGCRNLPTSFHDKTEGISADNHGNPFKVYTDSDCRGDSQVIPGGNNCFARDLTNFKADQAEPSRHAIKSIGPHRRSNSYKHHCVKLTSSVYKFEFLDSYSEEEKVTTDTVEMAQKTVFKNNGTAKLTQEYKVAKAVSETAEVTVATSLSSMHKGVVEDTITVEGGAGIPFLAEGKVKNELKLAYEYQHTSTTTDTTKKVITSSRDFSVRQQIEVPPCTEYSVSSYVIMVKDKSLEYKVYSKVTGELGGDRMTAEQIRDHFDGTLEIVGNFDDFTVIVEAKAAMTATYGVKSLIDGEGKKIPGCELRKKRRRNL